MTAPVVSPAGNVSRLREHLRHDVRRALAPRPRISGAEWSNTYRVLSPETATEPGLYCWQRAPFQREILDVCCDDSTQQIVLMTSARVGKTTLMENVTGYFIANDPSPILWVLPDAGEAVKFSTSNIDPMIRDSAPLRERVAPKRKRDGGNNLLHKRFIGGQLFLIGAKSSSGFHGKTIRVVLMDEVDRYDAFVGNDGDAVSLGMIRATTFGHRRKVILSSTPLIKDLSRIEKHFLESDQRYYHIPCPDCGVLQKLEWGNLVYKDREANPVYQCKYCPHQFDESHKFRLLQQGEWFKANPESRIAGFHLNALYSVHMTWAELVQEWIKAQGDRGRLQVFINSRLGEPWDDSAGRATASQLEKRLENYNAPLPTKDSHCNGAGVVVAAVDVQGNRLEFAAYGAGANDELWMLDTEIIDGDTNTDAPWNALTSIILHRKYKTAHGVPVGIRAVAIDSGDNTERVYRYVAHLRALSASTGVTRAIIAVKGQASFPRVIADRAHNSKQYNALFYPVGTDITKAHVTSLLANATPGPNYIHLPIAFPTDGPDPRYMDQEVLAQLVSERLVLTWKGSVPKRKWQAFRRNEQFDMLVYAYAALRHLGYPVINKLGAWAEELAARRPDGTVVTQDGDTTDGPLPTPVQPQPLVRPSHIHRANRKKPLISGNWTNGFR